VLVAAFPSVLDETLEHRSKSLFGNRHMLHVGRNVAAQRGPFTVTDVSIKTGVPYSSAHRLIRQLEGVGLLRRLPATAAGDPHHRFERLPHKFWGAVQQLCAPINPGVKPGKETSDA
jgi:hypothetical protein